MYETPWNSRTDSLAVLFRPREDCFSVSWRWKKYWPIVSSSFLWPELNRKILISGSQNSRRFFRMIKSSVFGRSLPSPCYFSCERGKTTNYVKTSSVQSSVGRVSHTQTSAHAYLLTCMCTCATVRLCVPKFLRGLIEDKAIQSKYHKYHI